MVGYFIKNGRNVLWEVPTRPIDPDLRNISFDDPHDGIYIFGQNKFPTRSITITTITHRNLTGNAEEFLLGALSVLLIALLSEIVQAILMCTRRARRANRKGVKMAFLVDEFYHFRNVWSHLFGRFARNGSSAVDPDKRRRVVTSFTILLIALGLMAADVFAVYLTQPISVSSENYQYNIRGITPTFTNQGLGRLVKRLAVERPCVTPTFVQEGQERLYTISACTTIDRERKFPANTNYTGTVTVSSFFHKAGADHNITFADDRFTIKSRTVVYVSEGPAWRVLYDVIEKDDFIFTKFLHELFITNVLEVSCNRRRADNNGFERTWCDEILRLKSDVFDQRIVEKRIVFWSKRNGKKEEALVPGVTSSYNVTLERAWESIDSGLSPLTTTSMLEEVEGPGQYVNITNEFKQDNLDGLLQEEGRVAGLLVLGIAFFLFAVLLFLLRVLLRPISLGSLAWDAREKMSESSSESGRKEDEEDGARRTSSAGVSSSTSLNFDDANEISQSAIEHEDSENGGVTDVIQANSMISAPSAEPTTVGKELGQEEV